MIYHVCSITRAASSTSGRARKQIPDDHFGQCHLLLRPCQEVCRLKRLRRLGLGAVNYAPHHNTDRVDIHRQFDLLVLRLRWGFNCDLCFSAAGKTQALDLE